MTDATLIHVPTTVHGRMLVRPASHAQAPLLAGFHGYGENAEQFLQSILTIPDLSGWHVVAIQALHPFYERRSNTVVASWMTSQDRELAVADNVAYVSRALDGLRERLETAPPAVFIGFSQGTAMAYRAACMSGHDVDAVIALGGDAPAEVEREDARTIPRVLIGRGTTDTWYTEAKLDDDVTRLAKRGSAVETCVFEGGHEWTDAFRDAAGAFLGSLSRQPLL